MTKDTRFKPGQSGNPAGRKAGEGKIAKLRADIAGHVPEIIAKLAEQAKNGDAASARLLLERYVPAYKPTDQAQALELPGSTLTEQGQAVITAIAAGELPAAQGGVLLTALANLAKLTESDELEKRIAALEASNGKTAVKP
jgi:hypothetical protein